MSPNPAQPVSEADRHLLDLVLTGDEHGWRALVARFQQRLLAFSRSKLNAADRTSVAEDLVQETFVSFLHAVKTFRGESSLETFLFRILRYRLSDYFRKLGSHSNVSSCEVANENTFRHELSVSQHAMQREQQQVVESNLGVAIFRLTCELKEHGKFRDLKVAEGLFYAGLRNQQLADLLVVSENEIGVTKHRLLKRFRDLLAQASDANEFSSHNSDFESSVLPSLYQTWENQRPSCPKRTSLGKYVLEILPPEWTDFIAFHVESLGCSYCKANLEELTDVSNSSQNDQMNEQLFQSTIGFLNRRK